MTEYAWNPRTKRQLDVMRECYEFLGIKCPESLLRAIDKDGRLSDFTPEQIKVAMETIAESRLSNGGNVFPRDVAPMNILWHLKSKRGDTIRGREQRAPFVRDPERIYYDDAIATFDGFPKVAQDFAVYLFLKTDDGKKHTRAWDRADAKMSEAERNQAKFHGDKQKWERGWFERWGAAMVAVRVMRNLKHPRHDEMMRLAEVETELVKEGK